MSQRMIWGNDLRIWITAIVFMIVLALLLIILRIVVGRVGIKKNTRWWVLVSKVAYSTSLLFILGFALLGGSRLLVLPELVSNSLRFLTLFLVLLQVGIWANVLVDGWLFYPQSRGPNNDGLENSGTKTLGLISGFVKGALWTILLLIFLDNIPGVEIAGLIASLGIGGIAVGLAVQSILKDLLGSLTIAIDKPFEVGDSLKVDEFLGTVEYIGLRSTRIRSNSGELLVFSNSDLLASRLQNFKDIRFRRNISKLLIAHLADSEKVQKLSERLKEIIEESQGVVFERAYLKQINEYAYIFEVSYVVENSSFDEYVFQVNAINLRIAKHLKENHLIYDHPLFVDGRGAV